MNNIMREQSGCINLCFTLFKLAQILSTTSLIVSQESAVVNQICTRRNCFILDFGPVLIGHLDLNHIEILTKLAQSLSVITLSHLQSLTQFLTISLSLCGRCIDRRHPLGDYRNRLLSSHILPVPLKLTVNNLINYIRSCIVIKQAPQIVIAPILRD